MKNDVNAMVIRVNKRRVYSKRYSDPFRHEYSSSDIIEPPYSFNDLVTFVEMSSILPQAIDAMCQNCEGYGYNIIEAKMTKEERDQYADAIVAERDEINAFFDYCNYDMSFTALRKKLRSDYETLGNAFFEVLRNKEGRIDGFEYLKNGSKPREDTVAEHNTGQRNRDAHAVRGKVRSIFSRSIRATTPTACRCQV